MNLHFEIRQKANSNQRKISEIICRLKSQASLNLKEGVFSIWDVDDNILPKLLDALEDAFEILGIDIIPPEDDVTADAFSETIQRAPALSQSVVHPNKEIEKRLNKLIDSVNLALFKKNASPDIVSSYISTAANELAMRYNPFPTPIMKTGDIAVCNYGFHMDGEISGRFVHAVVCAFGANNTVFVVPIAKTIQSDETNYMPFESPRDVTYSEKYASFTGGNILLRHGSWIRRERINHIAGSLKDSFFAKVLEELPKSFDFGGFLTNTPTKKTRKHKTHVVPSLFPSDKPSAELYIYNFFVDRLEDMLETTNLDKQIEIFCTALDLPKSSTTIQKALMFSPENTKITSTSVVAAIAKLDGSPEFAEGIHSFLKETFLLWHAKWNARSPEFELKENFRIVSYTAILKLFARLVNHAKLLESVEQN